jgi:predicted regulator of amino acid metabolism with ACT domain
LKELLKEGFIVEQLKNIKENLISCVHTQMGNLANVDAKELGEVIDMIKDIEEAIYYCTITESMQEGKDNSSKGE